MEADQTRGRTSTYRTLDPFQTSFHLPSHTVTSVGKLIVNNGVMPTVNPDIVSETGGSLGRNAEVQRRRRLIQPSVRKPAARITIRSARPLAKPRMLTCPSEYKKKQMKKVPPRGSVRDFPCRQCVARANKAPGHECASQNSTFEFPRLYTSYADIHGAETGAACWDCAKNGHTCRPVRHFCVLSGSRPLTKLHI